MKKGESEGSERREREREREKGERREESKGREREGKRWSCNLMSSWSRGPVVCAGRGQSYIGCNLPTRSSLLVESGGP